MRCVGRPLELDQALMVRGAVAGCGPTGDGWLHGDRRGLELKPFVLSRGLILDRDESSLALSLDECVQSKLLIVHQDISRDRADEELRLFEDVERLRAVGPRPVEDVQLHAGPEKEKANEEAPRGLSDEDVPRIPRQLKELPCSVRRLFVLPNDPDVPPVIFTGRRRAAMLDEQVKLALSRRAGELGFAARRVVDTAGIGEAVLLEVRPPLPYSVFLGRDGKADSVFDCLVELLAPLCPSPFIEVLLEEASHLHE